MRLKPDMKAYLMEAFAAPKPTEKEKFIKGLGQPRISTFSFLLSQISYIRKRVWILSFLLLAAAVIGADFAGRDGLWAVSAMMPFIALCAMTESARSMTYGMAELEMASRFSLKSITLARLGSIGMLHFIIFCVLVPFAGRGAPFSFLRTGVYLLVPYLLTAVLGLAAVRRVHGRESTYFCMGIAVFVGSLVFIIKGGLPAVYEERFFIWWCILGGWLFVRAWKEYSRAVNHKEELIWN